MDQFKWRFYQKMPPQQPSSDLLTIRQGRDETMSNFVSRFIKESLKIDDSNDLYIINAFKNGIDLHQAEVSTEDS
ncbi:hypothetical protein, partial [Escherichia coli]|uniref:hypothetical protein n=1 Tax=Escherichia coli TaxID=562 RepID=UPI003078D3DE